MGISKSACAVPEIMKQIDKANAAAATHRGMGLL
jgi:hypothetical protein